MKTFSIVLFSILVDASLGSPLAPPYQGVVVLTNGEVHSGEVSNVNNQLMLVVTDAKRLVVPAYQVREARYFDELNNINRKFISLSSHGKHLLYEVVVGGDISVVRIPRKISGNNEMEENPSTFQYYLLVASELKPFSQFLRSIISYMESRLGNLVRSYWKKNHLNPHQISDAIQIVLFYNEQLRSVPYLADLQN